MQKIIAKYADHVVDDKTQKRLNEPQKDHTGFNEGHEDFLKMLIEKIESGEIDPHKQSSLYNKAVYGQMSEEDQEKADMTGVSIMAVIRQIERTWKAHPHATFQIQNLVETVFQMKSKFEEKHGDVYII